MFERHCFRRTRVCLSCKKKGQHCRVRSLTRAHRGEAVYGWECESCGSVVTDLEGLYARNGVLDVGAPY